LRKSLASATLGILTLVILARTGALSLLLSANYLPHRYCYLAQPGLIWTNVVTDGLIAASYVLIFACLFWIAGRLRKIPEVQSYLWVFVSFGIFIVACASTHLMEVVTVWWPVYRISVAFKVVCAAASVTTAALFAKAAPGITTGIRQLSDVLATSQREHASDLLEHVRVRGQVRETDARLLAILDSVVDSIITIDATGIIVSINPAVVKMFEYPAEELLGKNVKVLMPEPNRSSHDGHLERYQSTGKTTVIGVGRKLEGLTKTGRAFPMELTITEVLLEGERLIVGLIRDLSERNLAEEELRKQAALLDLAGDAIMVRDLQSRVTLWNRGAQDLYGWSAAEANGQVSHQLLQTEFPLPLPAIEAALASKGDWEGELRHRTRQGKKVVVTSRWALQRDAGGAPTAILEINRDITERRQAEEVREWLAAIVESSDDAIISKTLDGIVTAWNGGAEKLFGYSSAEAVGRPVLMLVPEERVKEEVEILGRIAHGEGVEHFETVRVRKDGTRIDVSVTVSPIRDGNGKIVGASKVARDVTERKRAAEELARSREALARQTFILQSVLNSMTEGLVAADQQGKFTLWNPAAEKILGIGAANLSASEWGAHYGAYLPDKVTPFPNEQNPLLRAIAGEVSKAEIFFYSSEFDHGVWIECNGSPLRDKDGAVCGGVAAFGDITQRKADELEIRKLNEELEERIDERTGQLEAANRELEAFSYSVSHDLRAPLRHIGGFARILINDFGSEMAPEARDHLQRIHDAVIRMGLLVDGLLGLAKLGRQSLQLRQTELNAIVDQLIGVLQPECEGRAVEWRIARLPALQCDPILMGQVFQNLLGNALKYSRSRSRAVIEVGSIQEADKPPVIFVRDNGAGFNMEYAEKLFGVFQRMHTESEFEGTGVGLATVQRIIQKHGGTVWAEAEADRGATFYFSLGVREQAKVVLSHWP
jgi:PAS domain S-box-containing protein